MGRATADALGTLPLKVELPARDYAALVALGESQGVNAAVLGARVLALYARHEIGEPIKRKSHHRLNDGELMRLVERRKNGASVADLAREFDIAPDTVRKHINHLIFTPAKGSTSREK